MRLYGNAEDDQARPTEAVDYDDPLSSLLAVWPTGLASGSGGFLPIGGQGFCGGGFCAGGFCGPGGYFEWTQPTQLRNGTYCFGVLRSDSLSNERSSPGEEILVYVRDEPRPATNLELTAYDDDTNVLTVTWRRSPDM